MTSQSTNDQRRQMMEFFEDVLRQQPSLSADDRSQLLGQLRDALDSQAEAPPAELDVDGMRTSWAEALAILSPDADASEREASLRRIDDALAPLRKEAVQDAFEYTRRRREDGEDAAAQWLSERAKQRRSQRGAAPAASAASSVPGLRPAAPSPSTPVVGRRRR